MSQMYLNRSLEARLVQLNTFFPAIVLIGPRQIGKTSLVAALRNQIAAKSIYLDMERPADLAALTNLEAFAEQYLDTLIIIDEVQHRKGLFTELRSVIDRNRKPGRFILLGSASFDLIRDASETLAGRIAIEELTGMSMQEIGSEVDYLLHWQRGGYPKSVLAPSDELSFIWRENLLRTYLERDLAGIGLVSNPVQMRRVLTMLAHQSGQLLNYQSLAKSLQMDHRTLKEHLNILEQTFVARRLPAYHANIKKRLVKSPKMYLRDSGVLHALLGITNYLVLSRHPVFGPSFESYVVEQIYVAIQHQQTYLYFYRTSNGAELDLILERGGVIVAVVEIKTTPKPKLSKGLYTSRDDLGNPTALIICPTIDPPYPLADDIIVLGPKDIHRVVGDLF
ncbi:MAG: ATP-binding protein [Bacteroidota bacterium]